MAKKKKAAPAPNVFQTAAASAAIPQAKGKKADNLVLVTAPEIQTSMVEFTDQDAAEKLAKANKQMAGSVILPYCKDEFLKQFAELGRQPPTIKFRAADHDGVGVTLVTQDRGERYGVSDEQDEHLKAIIGERAEEVIIRDMSFSFNNAVLNKAGVMEALGKKIAELVADGVLTNEESAALVEATPRTTVRKGVLSDLSALCNNNPETMANLMEALGSHASAYIKA